ncbi:2-succinyl-5-enolpyruvyl-6-hydroxy-3-cyclohexene-1-carboxylic-acid synthase [Eggerthellaceae bacterium 3-80]|nr:2-succinyl-5-enolpyruvyl-6-hydroxy-3-cyclohexene-1-carboxylic-acid synthase [bacterium D16-34]
MKANPQVTARFLTAFIDELVRWGVHDVVISPGSRSTPLAVTVFEWSIRHPEMLSVHLDIDERSAGFFALGMAKASGRPSVLICTSGTAVANYYPAVMEANISRVPLIVLTGDRPARLQNLGAPQTCDQLGVFGSHVRTFRQMPLPTDDAESLLFAAQAARELVAYSLPLGMPKTQKALTYPISGACGGAPVHANFPFEEPLLPDRRLLDEIIDKQPLSRSDAYVVGQATLSHNQALDIADLLKNKRVLVLAGEGTARTQAEAQQIFAWIQQVDAVVFADPLSGLRAFDEANVLSSYDAVLQPGGVIPEGLLYPQMIIRFGRYPISKRATQFVESACSAGAVEVVVDPLETRDFLSATGMFVRMSPVEFAQALNQTDQQNDAHVWVDSWVVAEKAAKEELEHIKSAGEGEFIEALLHEIVPESCLFAGNSMSVRLLDAFYASGQNKCLCMLGNRGLNGIDGTLSTAIGAAKCLGTTTVLLGDLALLHDINALALQREVLMWENQPSIVVVLFNNNGGAIFDMLPQASDDRYFERLFLTPQSIDFQQVGAGFGVPVCVVSEKDEFAKAYKQALATPGISLIEIKTELRGVQSRIYSPVKSVVDKG